MSTAIPRRAPGARPAVRALVGAWGALSALVACAPTAPTSLPAPCPTPLERAVDAARQAQGRPPSARPWVPPARSPDLSLPGIEGLALDPDPLARGAHPVERWWRDPRTCQLLGGAYAGPLPGPWSPPPQDQALPAGTWGATEGSEGDGRRAWPARDEAAGGGPASVRALLVTADDSGAAADAQRWLDALGALGARGRSLHRPGRRALEDALGALCHGLTGREAVIFVAAGPADPGSSAGPADPAGPSGSGAPPALLLGPGGAAGDEAISLPRLAALLGAQCAQAGLLVVVLDTSYAGQLARALPPRPPALVWTASEADAPRLDVGEGGLLTAALAPLVAGRARAACLTAPAGLASSPEPSREPSSKVRPEPSLGDVAAVFRDEGVVAAMRAERWRRFGAPDLALGASPGRGAASLAAVTADVPPTPLTVRGQPPAPARCADDEDCAPLQGACPAGEGAPPGGDAACLVWSCQGGACVIADTPGLPCDDANPCTVDDTCRVGGGCAGTVDPCDDGDPCTDDTCLFHEGCVHVPGAAGRPCDDGDACTRGDVCDGGGGCVGAARDCDDGDPCTVDDCDPERGCVNHVENVACDDGDPCTVLDFCGYGACRGQPKSCDDGDACTEDSCDPQTGACVAAPRPPGSPCDDGDPCTVGDACTEAGCEGQPRSCDDGLDCTYDSCEQGICHHLPAPGSCLGAQGCVPVGAHLPTAPCLVCAATNTVQPDDGAPCADDGVACTVDVCEQGQCAHLNDPGTCTTDEGACVGIGQLMAPCLRCVGTGVAGAEPAGAPCDDGDPCTVDDACVPGGQCAGERLPCCPLGPPLACDASAHGDTSAAGAPSAQLGWSCLPGALTEGPEAAYPFTAPCAGAFTFHLEGPDGPSGGPPAGAPDGRVLLFVRGGPDACQQGTCEAYAQLGSAAGLTRDLSAGEEVTLGVDGLNGAAGPFVLSVTCPCAGSAAPEGAP